MGGEGHKRNLRMGGTQYYRVPEGHKEIAGLKQKAPVTEGKRQGHRHGQLLSGGEKAPEGSWEHVVRDERVGERRVSVLVTRIRGEGWVKRAEEEQEVLRILSEASMGLVWKQAPQRAIRLFGQWEGNVSFGRGAWVPNCGELPLDLTIGSQCFLGNGKSYFSVT